MLNRNTAIERYVYDLGAEGINNLASWLSQYTNEFAGLEWYQMYEFNEMFGGMEPYEVAVMLNRGNFDTNDDWFRLPDYNVDIESVDDSTMKDDVYAWADDVIRFLLQDADSETSTGDTVLDSLIHAPETAMFNENYEMIAR